MTRDLGDAGNRIRHEVHHQLRERRIKGVVRERKLLRRREPDVHPWMSLAGRRDEWLGRVGGRDCVRPETADELRHERPRPAADVEDPLSGLDPREVGEPQGELRRIAAHEGVVGLGGDGKAHRGAPAAGAPTRPVTG